jgi:hypothetical protein
MIRELRKVLAVQRYEVLPACELSPGTLTDATLREAIRQSDLLLVHWRTAGSHREMIRRIGKLENPQEDQEDQEGINHGEIREIREHEARGRTGKACANERRGSPER